MRVSDEDALICDFAQYYHVFDYRALPTKQAAILACGLPAESRIKRKMAGIRVGTDTLLRAAILDGIRTLIWMQSKDARSGRNRPQPIYPMFVGGEERKKEDTMTFPSGEEFEKYRARILREVR